MIPPPLMLLATQCTPAECESVTIPRKFKRRIGSFFFSPVLTLWSGEAILAVKYGGESYLLIWRNQSARSAHIFVHRVITIMCV